MRRIGRWVFALVAGISLTVSTFISLNAGTPREPEAVLTTRSCDPRERSAADYVAAGRLAGAVVYRVAGTVEHDGRQSQRAYQNVAGSGFRFCDEDFSESSAS